MTGSLRKTKNHKGVIINNSTTPAQTGKAHDFILIKRNLIWKWATASLSTSQACSPPLCSSQTDCGAWCLSEQNPQMRKVRDKEWPLHTGSSLRQQQPLPRSGALTDNQVKASLTTWLKMQTNPFPSLPLSPLVSFSLSLFLSPLPCWKFPQSPFFLLLHYTFCFCMNLSTVSPHKKVCSRRAGIFAFTHFVHCCVQAPQYSACSTGTCWLSQEMNMCSYQKTTNVI